MPVRHVAHGRHEFPRFARWRGGDRISTHSVKLGDERAEDGRVVLVRRVCPLLGRNGDQMVAEVDEHVHKVPVI